MTAATECVPVSSEAELRDLLGEPAARSVTKERPRLRPMAQARLVQAQAHGANGPNQILLKLALAQLPR